MFNQTGLGLKPAAVYSSLILAACGKAFFYQQFGKEIGSQVPQNSAVFQMVGEFFINKLRGETISFPKDILSAVILIRDKNSLLVLNKHIQNIHQAAKEISQKQSERYEQAWEKDYETNQNRITKFFATQDEQFWQIILNIFRFAYHTLITQQCSENNNLVHIIQAINEFDQLIKMQNPVSLLPFNLLFPAGFTAQDLVPHLEERRCGSLVLNFLLVQKSIDNKEAIERGKAYRNRESKDEIDKLTINLVTDFLLNFDKELTAIKNFIDNCTGLTTREDIARIKECFTWCVKDICSYANSEAAQNLIQEHLTIVKDIQEKTDFYLFIIQKQQLLKTTINNLATLLPELSNNHFDNMALAKLNEFQTQIVATDNLLQKVHQEIQLIFNNATQLIIVYKNLKSNTITPEHVELFTEAKNFVTKMSPNIENIVKEFHTLTQEFNIKKTAIPPRPTEIDKIKKSIINIASDLQGYTNQVSVLIDKIKPQPNEPAISAERIVLICFYQQELNDLRELKQPLDNQIKAIKTFATQLNPSKIFKINIKKREESADSKESSTTKKPRSEDSQSSDTKKSF